MNSSNNNICRCKAMFVAVFVLISNLYLGQFSEDKQKSDSMDIWMSKFYRITNFKTSKNNRWALFTKSYRNNSDTVLVIDSRKPMIPVDTILKKNNFYFTNNGFLVSSGNLETEIIDLENNRKQTFANSKIAGILEKEKIYFVHTTSNDLLVNDFKGHNLSTISSVVKVSTNSKDKLFFTQKIGNDNSLFKIVRGKPIKLFSTFNDIIKIELTLSEKYLLVTEKKGALLQINFIDYNIATLENQKAFSEVGDLATVHEIQNGKGFLIDFQYTMSKDNSEMLTILHGADEDLRAKNYKDVKHQYRYFDAESGKDYKIPRDQFSAFFQFQNLHYLLAFNLSEKYDYTYGSLQVPMFLYDFEEESYFPVFSATSQVYTSNMGRYMIAFEKLENIWKLYNVKNKSSLAIANSKLKNPTFTQDNRYIFFESENDLWRFDIASQKLSPLQITTTDVAYLYSRKMINNNNPYGLSLVQSVFDSPKDIIIKIYNKKTSKVSLVLWNQFNKKTLIEQTDNSIKNIAFNGTSKFLTLEESYNHPPQILQYNTDNRSANVVFKSNPTDSKISLLKRKIITYSTTSAKHLTGLLYYPLLYDPPKKYPMVVKVYQKQSENSGVYPFPEYNHDGFNLRLLLEQGYFVLLPDIEFDNRGAGISALDCVNEALNIALQTTGSIDPTRIGLTGHSMGGYETNFIATRSKRFATYISGASVSNIIRAYFSFIKYTNSAGYARYEKDGQFEMPSSFSENKKLYNDNNPINNVEDVSAPFLLWSGLRDENVAPDNTMSFFMGLMRNKKPVVALLYKYAGHDMGIKTPESRDLSLRNLDWWNYFLKYKKDVEWIKNEMDKHKK